MNALATITRVRALLQFGQTTRYHTELLTRSQDVAQHSFNVAWLCTELSDWAPSAGLLMAALAHDAGERWTGDIPAPTKRGMPGMRAHMDELELQKLREQGITFKYELTPAEQAILSLADALEGALFCLRELRLGNTIVIDPAEGGAALNFMNYIHALLTRFPNPVGEILYNHLVTQYGRYWPTQSAEIRGLFPQLSTARSE